MDELADLATIDGFFQNQSGDQLSKKELYTNLTLDVCTALKNPRSLGLGAFGSDTPRGLGQVMAAFLLTQPTRGMNAWAGTQAPNATSDEIGAITGNPFYCETPASWPYPNDVHVDWPTYFAINATQPWGAVKTQVYNAITAMQVMAAYPFPPPIDKYVYEFWVTANSDLQQIAATPTPVDPQVVEYWVTLFTVSNYSAMTTQIEAILKKKEKNAKRKALMDVIGLAVASIVVMFLLPAIIAAAISVIKTVITTYTQIQQQKAAAKQLNDTSKMFAADAPAFSAKVDAASQLMDAEAAAQAAAGTPSPDLQAAIQQVKDNTPFTVSTPVLIGGGVAAAGLAVFLIFK